MDIYIFHMIRATSVKYKKWKNTFHNKKLCKKENPSINIYTPKPMYPRYPRHHHDRYWNPYYGYPYGYGYPYYYGPPPSPLPYIVNPYESSYLYYAALANSTPAPPTPLQVAYSANYY